MPRLAAVAGSIVVLCLALCSTAVYAQGGLNEALLTEGAKNQVIQFNPTAALQVRIFADRFVPNSSEFSLSFEGADYAAQRAENLGNGQVRVYFVRVGDWSNVRFTQGGDSLGKALMDQAQAKQVIQFNPGASLQQRMFADGFVPNSAEFTAQVGGVSYAAQRAENLGNGQVRVYYVAVGDWANVRNTAQNVNAAAVAPPQPAAPAQQPPTQPASSEIALSSTLQILVKNDGPGLETVTLKNTAQTDQPLGGWRIQSYSGKCERQVDQLFTFPDGFKLAAGASLNIYSGYKNSPPSNGIKWRSDNVWDNGDDKAELIRPDGTVAAVHAYGGC